MLSCIFFLSSLLFSWHWISSILILSSTHADTHSSFLHCLFSLLLKRQPSKVQSGHRLHAEESFLGLPHDFGINSSWTSYMVFHELVPDTTDSLLCPRTPLFPLLLLAPSRVPAHLILQSFMFAPAGVPLLECPKPDRNSKNRLIYYGSQTNDVQSRPPEALESQGHIRHE